MLRLSLALLLVTTTASAAMPFDLPQVAVPAPTATEWPLTIAAPFKSPPATLVLPQVWVPCGGVLLLDYLPRTAIGLIELYGSEERFRTALQTTQIEVVHLSTRNAAAERPEDYVERDPVALDEVQMSLLKHALTADAAYDWYAEPELGSAPWYDLRIRLRHGEKSSPPISASLPAPYA